MQASRFRATGYVVFVACGGLVFVAASLGGIYDPAAGVTGSAWQGWLFVAASTALTIRGLVLGAEVRGESLLLRNIFLTRRVPLASIRAVAVMPYDGLLTRGATSRWLTCLAIAIDGDELSTTAWGLVGRRRGIEALASRLAQRLAVPVTPDSGDP